MTKNKLIKTIILMHCITIIQIVCTGTNPIDSGEAGNNSLYGPYAVLDTLSPNFYTAFVPRIELLAGVLSQTSWMNIRGPQGLGNQYFRRLKKFFEPYKNHPAILQAEDFTQKGFIYDGPCAIVMSMGPLPALEAPIRYNSSMVKRAGGEISIENFRKALINLAETSDFLTWFQSQRDSFAFCMDTLLRNFDGKSVTEWLENFFGWNGNVFHCVFAPAMFSAGGYGFNIMHEDTMHIGQIMRESGVSQDAPLFSRDYLSFLSIHEFGHSFVNPTVDSYNELIKKYDLKVFFDQVRDIMTQQAYPDVKTFLNETLIRSITIEALHDIESISAEKRQELIDSEEKRGFHLVEFTLQQISIYRANRDLYPDFKQFLPFIFKAFHDNKGSLITRH